jgi:hypothetical protein
MSMAQLSPNSVIANPAHVNPQVKADQITSAPKVNQEAQQSIQATRTDTATFSHQAVKKLVNDVHSAIQDLKDGVTESASKAVKDNA